MAREFFGTLFLTKYFASNDEKFNNCVLVDSFVHSFIHQLIRFVYLTFGADKTISARC